MHSARKAESALCEPLLMLAGPIADFSGSGGTTVSAATSTGGNTGAFPTDGSTASDTAQGVSSGGNPPAGVIVGAVLGALAGVVSLTCRLS